MGGGGEFCTNKINKNTNINTGKMNSKSYLGQTLTISAAQITKKILKVYKKGNMISSQILGGTLVKE